MKSKYFISQKLIFIGILLFLLISCKTVATYDTTTFQKTAVLKAKMLVLMDHATEDYKYSSDKIDEILIESESLYAMQKARTKNSETIGHWKKLMEVDQLTKQSVIPGFFKFWKKKTTLSQDFIDDAKIQISDGFDEILKLESMKIKE